MTAEVAIMHWLTIRGVNEKTAHVDQAVRHSMT
jgi:hypothetical protein